MFSTGNHFFKSPSYLLVFFSTQDRQKATLGLEECPHVFGHRHAQRLALGRAVHGTLLSRAHSDQWLHAGGHRAPQLSRWIRWFGTDFYGFLSAVKDGSRLQLENTESMRCFRKARDFFFGVFGRNLDIWSSEVDCKIAQNWQSQQNLIYTLETASIPKTRLLPEWKTMYLSLTSSGSALGCLGEFNVCPFPEHTLWSSTSG